MQVSTLWLKRQGRFELVTAWLSPEFENIENFGFEMLSGRVIKAYQIALKEQELTHTSKQHRLRVYKSRGNDKARSNRPGFSY